MEATESQLVPCIFHNFLRVPHIPPSHIRNSPDTAPESPAAERKCCGFASENRRRRVFPRHSFRRRRHAGRTALKPVRDSTGCENRNASESEPIHRPRREPVPSGETKTLPGPGNGKGRPGLNCPERPLLSGSHPAAFLREEGRQTGGMFSCEGSQLARMPFIDLPVRRMSQSATTRSRIETEVQSIVIALMCSTSTTM